MFVPECKPYTHTIGLALTAQVQSGKISEQGFPG